MQKVNSLRKMKTKDQKIQDLWYSFDVTLSWHLSQATLVIFEF